MRMIGFGLALMLSAVAAARDHDAYIWQRRWTPELAAGAVALADVFSAYRVLVGEGNAHDVMPVTVDWSAVARARRPVVLVIRWPGATPWTDATPLLSAIASARALAAKAGVRVTGVEIDHDCARARLPDYATLLRELRTRLDRALPLSITALPDWLAAPELPSVLAAVDASVLQVHAVAKPGDGLFDAAQALRWVRAYAATSAKSFRVALPAYGSRVTLASDGRVLAIDSDAATMPVFDAEARELAVDPRRVAVVLRRLRDAPPPRFAGVSWFRLPLPGDRRAYAPDTIRALVGDAAPTGAVSAQRVRIGSGPNDDVVLRNDPGIDRLAPRTIRVPASCRDGEGVAGYRFDPARARFDSNAPPLLKPGTSRTIGWVHCPETPLP